MQVRVLYGFVDARQSFRSYVPGDVVEMPKEKAASLIAQGAVEAVTERPASRRETKVTKPAESKAAPVAD